MGSFSIWHWLIVLAIVLLIFGTKKLRNIGSDLGGAMRDFKKGMEGDEEAKAAREREEKLRADPPVTGQVPPTHTESTEPRDRAP